MPADSEKMDAKTASPQLVDADGRSLEPEVGDIVTTTIVGGAKATARGNDGYLDAEVGDLQPASADAAVSTPLQLVTKTLDCTDDPTESPYTLRAFVLGLGLSAFGAVIAEIFYFKPQTVTVNAIFLVILAYCFGELTTFIPRWGPVGRFLNPGPFNQKEHVFIVIMASSASVSALGTEQLAVQTLWYNEEPNAASAIFMLLSSQCIGYGIIGLMRKMFVYPTKFVWPLSLPLATTFQSMHLDKALARKRLKVFWVVCILVMIWEIVPEYIFPLTTGISIFCLANQHSEVFTYLFGGSNGDEGMGFLSWCMDWQYVGTSQFVLPLNTLFNQLVGYLLCVTLTVAAYYGNVWNATNFPFLAQDLFIANGTDTYNQTMILGANNKVDQAKLAEYGLPWFATSNALSLLTMNMGVTAGVVHIFLWNWSDIGFIFDIFRPSELKKRFDYIKSGAMLRFWKEDGAFPDETYPGTEGDPHYALMRAYKEAPAWWYHVVLVLAIVIGLICCYQQRTELPWWAFLIAVLLSWFLSIFYAAIYGITGFYYQPTTAVQMIGGYLRPGYPVANMMFTLYGSNGLVQALLMLSDLKLAHYTKLPPRATFLSQMLGSILGAILNWVMMNDIVKEHRDVLLSVEGTNLWSGQNVQTYNAQAVAWGGAGDKIFGRDGEYWYVPMGLLFGLFVPLPFYLVHRFFPKLRFDQVNTYIICTWLGWLSVGINSSLLPYFVFGFFAQYYLRRYHPVLFTRWNIIISAAIAGGCAIIIFILTFAVEGGSGTAHNFPQWWGNNMEGNVDHCKYMN